jgi:hypothetical protein
LLQGSRRLGQPAQQNKGDHQNPGCDRCRFHELTP